VCVLYRTRAWTNDISRSGRTKNLVCAFPSFWSSDLRRPVPRRCTRSCRCIQTFRRTFRAKRRSKKYNFSTAATTTKAWTGKQRRGGDVARNEFDMYARRFRYIEFFPSNNDSVDNKMAFEKSATYFDADIVPKRVHALLPNVKLVSTHISIYVSPYARAQKLTQIYIYMYTRAIWCRWPYWSRRPRGPTAGINTPKRTAIRPRLSIRSIKWSRPTNLPRRNHCETSVTGERRRQLKMFKIRRLSFPVMTNRFLFFFCFF